MSDTRRLTSKDFFLIALMMGLFLFCFVVHALEEDKLNRRIHNLEQLHGIETWK